MKTLRTTLAALVAIALCAGLLVGLPDLGLADDMGGGAAQLCEVSYIADDGAEWIVSDCPVLEGGNTTLGGGIYAVLDDVTMGNELVVEGNVELIISNDRTLFAPYGIRIKPGAKLTIYGQPDATGTLLVYDGITTWTGDAYQPNGTMQVVDGMVSEDGMMSEDGMVSEDAAPQNTAPANAQPTNKVGVGPESFAVAPTCDVIAFDHEPAADEVGEYQQSPELTSQLLGSAYLWVFPAEVKAEEAPEEPPAEEATSEDQNTEEPAPEETVVEEPEQENTDDTDSDDQDADDQGDADVEDGDNTDADAEDQDAEGQDAEDQAGDTDDADAEDQDAEDQDGDADDADGEADDQGDAEEQELLDFAATGASVSSAADSSTELKVANGAAADKSVSKEEEDAEPTEADDAPQLSTEDESDDANTVTVTFDANGGSGTMDPITVAPGQTFQLPECGFEPPEGYTFSQWSLGNPGSNVSVPSSMTVRAWWSEADNTDDNDQSDDQSDNTPSDSDNDAKGNDANKDSGNDTSTPAQSTTTNDSTSTSDTTDTTTSDTTTDTSSTSQSTSTSPQTGDPQGPMYSVVALMATGLASLALSVKARRME